MRLLGKQPNPALTGLGVDGAMRAGGSPQQFLLPPDEDGRGGSAIGPAGGGGDLASLWLLLSH